MQLSKTKTHASSYGYPRATVLEINVYQDCSLSLVGFADL